MDHQHRSERVEYVSPAFEKLWGCKADDLYRDARKWTEAIHPEDRERVHKAFGKWLSVAKHTDFEVEYRVVKPDGAVVWIADKGTFIEGINGHSDRVAGIARDVTVNKTCSASGRTIRERIANILG